MKRKSIRDLNDDVSQNGGGTSSKSKVSLRFISRKIISLVKEDQQVYQKPLRHSLDTNVLPRYERCIADLYTFISENQEDLLLDAEILKTFESMSLLAMESGQDGNHLQEILIQQGWTGLQYNLAELDVDILTQSLGTLYMSRVLPYKIMTEEQAEFDAKPALFMQEDSLIKSFCPNSLLHIISADILYDLSIDMKCKSSKVYGACMLADISGFTKMSSRHCQEGAKGLDKLHKATNGFLGKLVSTIYSYGGDVISFAGDALICTFVSDEQFFVENPDDDDEINTTVDSSIMKESCLRAIQCALELKDYYNDDLTCHIAISCGKMSFASLGGCNDEWVCLLNGACISELSQAIDDAGSREVVVTSQVFSSAFSALTTAMIPTTKTIISSIDLTTEQDSSHVHLASGNVGILSLDSAIQLFKEKNNRITQFETEDDLLDLARIFVPPPANLAICSGSFDHINELREVTTMFFKLDSYSPHTHEDPTTLQSFFVMAQNFLHASGGFMRQFLIDDKGCVLIGMWGVPSFSHANNAIRALFCATSIMEDLQLLAHRGSIGITTGSIYCGNVGSPLRRDYVGIGDKVNLAARLMGKAKGRILVDEASYQQLSSNAKKNLTKSTEGLTLKGIAEPIYPYIITDYSNAVFKLDDQVENSNAMYLDPTVTRILEDQLDRVSATSGNSHNQIAPMEFDLSQGMKRGGKSTLKLLSNKLDNQASLTVLRGMPGMGKKTAALYFMRSAKNRYLRTVFISLRSGDEIKPFGLMRKLTLSLMDPQEFITDEEQRRTLDTLLTKIYDSESRRSRAMIAMKIVLDLKWAGDADSSEDQMTLHGDKTLREVLLYILIKQTTAIAIENAQYCDELSWNELLLVVEMPARIALLITLSSLIKGNTTAAGNGGGNGPPVSSPNSPSVKSRKSYADSGKANKIPPASLKVETNLGNRLRSSEFFASVECRPNCMILDLPPLTKDDVGKILVRILGKDIDDVIVKLVYDVSSGNPFWCQLVARHIKDSGLDDFNDALKNDKSRNPLNVVFICRLEKLAPDHQVIARYASVLGDEFTLSRLFNVLPPKFQENLDHCLTILSEYGFILCIDQNPPSYAFQNLLIRKFLYELTPYSEQRKIHEAFAWYMLGEERDNLRPFYSLLSYHFLNSSGCEDEAFKYTVKAADQAIAQGAFHNGLFYVREAMKICNDLDKKDILLSVIECAIKDMEPKGFAAISAKSAKIVKSLGRKSSLSESVKMVISGDSADIDEYRTLKDELMQQIQALESTSPASASATNNASGGDQYLMERPISDSKDRRKPRKKSSLADVAGLLASAGAATIGAAPPDSKPLGNAWQPSYTATRAIKPSSSRDQPRRSALGCVIQ